LEQTADTPAAMDADGNPANVDADIDTVWATLDGMLDATLAFLPKLVIGLVVFALFWLLAAGVRRVVHRATAGHPAKNFGLVAGRLARWGLILLGGLVAVTIMLPSVRPVDLLSVLGIGSVAIGFAFKDVLQNFLAGILILLRQPFAIGDQIRFKEFEGTVEAIEARTTVIKTYDGRRVFVPNGELFTNAVTVNTAYPVRRSEHDVGIGYGDDIREAARIIREALAGVEGVVADPPPQAIAMALDGSTINIRARWWTASKQSEVMRIRHEAIAAIREALGEAGIDLPFPTQVVLFHDQTEATDGDRRRQREGWPAGRNPPPARTIAAALGEDHAEPAAEGGRRQERG